jgi:hypothetical protein
VMAAFIEMKGALDAEWQLVTEQLTAPAAV